MNLPPTDSDIAFEQLLQATNGGFALGFLERPLFRFR
jgi:hypothetical protein